MTITYTVKPYINNNKDMKTFQSSKEAVAYLNSFLTDEMPVMYAEDYYYIGKLIPSEVPSEWTL